MFGEKPCQISINKVEIESNVKFECVLKLGYLSATLGAGGGVEEAARACMRGAWVKFIELSPILMVHGALYHMKGKIELAFLFFRIPRDSIRQTFICIPHPYTSKTLSSFHHFPLNRLHTYSL